MRLYLSIKEEALKLTKAPRRSFSLYWNAYGGFKALWGSFYLWTALVLAFLLTLVALSGDSSESEIWNWADETINILPDVLGFSLGGYAMLVGFGDENFLQAIRGADEDGTASPYMEVNAAFVHFILVQALALIFAVVAKSLGVYDYLFVYYFGCVLLVYALLTILATTFAVLNMANWFDQSDD